MNPTRTVGQLRRRTFALGALVLVPLAARAQAYPARAMRFVVPFPPGSGTDATARIFAKSIGEATGQGVVVDNRSGGNGFIGVQSALGAAADGYTVFIGSNSTLSTNAALFRKLPYDPIADFAPIALLSRGPCLIIVPAASPYATLGALLADAKARPGQLSYGAGSVSYTLYSEWVNQIAGVKTLNVPFRGAGDAITAVAAGTVDFAVVDASGAVELVKSGRLKALASTGPQRMKLLPNVPTAVEAGLPGYEAFNWVAAAVSIKTPAPVIERLVALFRQAAVSNDVRAYYEAQTTELIVGTPEELRRYQVAEIARWKRLATIAGVELQ